MEPSHAHKEKLILSSVNIVISICTTFTTNSTFALDRQDWKNKKTCLPTILLKPTLTLVPFVYFQFKYKKVSFYT